MTQSNQSQVFPEAPDPILAELWQVKREINMAADYRIDVLVEMANAAAERVRGQWRLEDKRDCPKSE